ncbi:MAG: hypothetical protein U9N19_05930, partial [Thermodesulfobacteriota bacterium]|nr:hypothetical protein [Thermodesulfobacteriota bacterium]
CKTTYWPYFTIATICAIALSSSAIVVLIHSWKKTITACPLKAQESLQNCVTKLACVYMKYPEIPGAV